MAREKQAGDPAREKVSPGRKVTEATEKSRQREVDGLTWMCEGDTSRKWALVAEKTTTLADLNPAIILLGVCLKDHVWQLGRKKCTMMVLLVADGGEKVESTLRLNPGVLLVGMEDEAATVKNSMTFLKKKKKEPGGPGGCTEPSCPQGSSPLRDQGYGGPGIWGRGSRGVCTPDGGRQLLMR